MSNINTLNDKLELIKNAILKHTPAKYIYLFGSYAYGEPKEESDIDICAVVPDEFTPWDLHHLWVEITSEWIGIIDEEVELILKTESKFQYRKTRSLFEETICQKGIVLYENFG